VDDLAAYSDHAVAQDYRLGGVTGKVSGHLALHCIHHINRVTLIMALPSWQFHVP